MHLELFPLRKGRFINTWKNGFAMKASQCSGHLYWIKPWIQTFWSNYSGTQYWLTGPEYYSTCGRCSTKDQKAHQHLKNRFAMKESQCSGHLYWIKPWIQTFWSNFSGTKCWRTRPEHLSTCGRCFTKYQKTPQHLEKWFRCEGNSIFWPCHWITPWIHTFWAHCSGTQSWLAPPEYQSTHGICCTMDPKTFQNLEDQYCHEHQLVFWPFLVDQAMITHILARYGGTKWWLISPGHLFAHDRCSTPGKLVLP